MSEKLHKTEKRLDFELDETEEIKFLRSLVNNNLESYANEHADNNNSLSSLNEEENEDDNDTDTIDNNDFNEDISEDENPDEVISELGNIHLFLFCIVFMCCILIVFNYI